VQREDFSALRTVKSFLPLNPPPCGIPQDSALEALCLSQANQVIGSHQQQQLQQQLHRHSQVPEGDTLCRDVLIDEGLVFTQLAKETALESLSMAQRVRWRPF